MTRIKELAFVLSDIGEEMPWLLHRAEGVPSETIALAAEIKNRLEALSSALPEVACRCIPVQPGGPCGCRCHGVDEEPNGDLAMVKP